MSHHQPTLSIETITPAGAQQMLDLNTSNRNVRPYRVQKYARDMAAGKWIVTGEPIILNGRTLVNGQHRLLACIEAGVPFTTAVFRNATDDVYVVVDSGLARTAGDTLHHDGFKHANLLASAARLVIGYRQAIIASGPVFSSFATHEAIKSEIERSVERYQSLAERAFAARRPGFNSSAFVTIALLLGEAVGETECDEWLDGAVTGVGLQFGDPRIAMRNWIVGNRKRGGIVELSAWIRARNAHANRETRTIIKPWFTGTPFPQLIEEKS